jgi:crossover junction endodeoxyribonuclease RuvC
MILGIDAGISGAIALVDNDGKLKQVSGVVTYWHKMKTKTKSKIVNGVTVAGTYKRRRKINIPDTVGLLEKMIHGYDIKVCYIENVQAFNGQGVTSSFNFGESFGILQGIVAAKGIEIIFVTPQKWKKEVGLIKADKEASIPVVKAIFGAECLPAAISHDLADACLIAWYGYLHTAKE